MATDTHRSKRDPSIALDTFYKLKNSCFSLLSKYYPSETQNLIKQLTALDSSIQSNQPKAVLIVLKRYLKNCDPFLKIPEQDREAIKASLIAVISNLRKLDDQATQLNIQVNNAVDAHTLITTSSMISSLEAFMLAARSLNSKQTYLSANEPKIAKQATFYGDPSKGSIDPRCVVIADELKGLCKAIQSDIGSSETMPKGLVINLMVCLLDAFKRVESLMSENFSTDKLLKCIQNEIKLIRKIYPELAQAGEDLHKAVANYQYQKI